MRSIVSSWIKGTAFFALRRYDEAIASLAQIDARIISAKGWLAASLAFAGRQDEARTVLDEFLKAAERDLARMPAGPDEWRAYWRRDGQFEHEDEIEHLFEGLRMAGLDL